MRALEGRSAVDQRAKIEETLPKPGRLVEGRDSIQRDFEAIVRDLNREIQNIDRTYLSRKGRRTFSQKTREAAAINQGELGSLLKMAEEMLGQFDKKDQATQEVPTVLNQADRDLLNKYTGGVSSP